MRGPNLWSLSRVIVAEIRLGTLRGRTTDTFPGFTRRLLEHLPTLSQHPCSRERPGGFAERLEEGTELPHVLEHVALELQALAGPRVHFGRIVPAGEDTTWVVVEYEEEALGMESVRLGVDLVRACLDGSPFDTTGVAAHLLELYEEVRLGPSTAAIVEEARRRGIPVRRMNGHSLVQLGLGANLRRIQAATSDGTSAIALEIAQDKDETRGVLRNVGLPVSEGEVAEDETGAVEAAGRLDYPVILKPAHGNHGRGVSMALGDADAVRNAWPITASHGLPVVVERWVAGSDHRVLVVDGRVAAVAERIPARVTGDGHSTIRELIERENRDGRRGKGHCRVLSHLPADRETECFLATSGRTLETVPAAGEQVRLRSAANLSSGGTAIDRTDEIHPDNATACEMAAGVVGLNIAGIDVITPDITVPFRENGGVILEVNAGPGIRMHLAPTEGRPRNVAAPIVDMLFPPGAEATIPLIAVTGTNGKTTTVRLIAHIFRHTGRRVGFTTTDGIYLGNRLVMEGDMTGPFSANVILSNATVDVAVLETARGGILREGLGFEEADVGVVLNISEDHLGLGGIETADELAELKGVVARVVKRDGHAVLNADDPRVRAMAERTDGDVVLFSAGDPEGAAHLEAHLERGGVAVRMEEDTFVVRRGRLRIPIAEVAEVPLMMGGDALFQRENVMAAVAAAYVQGVRYDDIRSALLSFFPSRSMTPGRMNLVPVGGARVLVDYGHNSAAIDAVLGTARRMQAHRRIGLIAVPGDRRDEDIRRAGRAAAVLDEVIVKEDADRRGRAPGEIASLLVEGLREGGMPAERIRIIHHEPEAVDAALSGLREGDLVVILVDDITYVLNRVTAAAEGAG
jgi:cyanophycin synthetase